MGEQASRMRFEQGRNYYADLGLDFPSDEVSIKQKYRKAALKYHPDRNPGNEEEAKSAFVIIQSAFDVLSDPSLKDKYDSTYLQRFSDVGSGAGVSARHHYTAGRASGVSGNPWQDYGKEFQPPPQRADRRPRQPQQPPPPPQPSASQRWSKWQQFKTPPTAKTTDPDPEDVYEAFNHMRKPQPPPRQPQPDPTEETRRREAEEARRRDVEEARRRQAEDARRRQAEEASRQPDQPPLPPRTASMRQRAEAQFGGKKTGYYPHSPMPEDEPQVGSTKNYETSRHTSDLFAETARRARTAAATAAAFTGAAAATAAAAAAAASATSGGNGSATEDSHDERRETYLHERKPSEYRSHGGEKYDPFDGRRPSMRGRRRRAPDPSETSDTQSQTGGPQRSSSLPKDEAPGTNGSPHWDTEQDSDRPRTSGRMPAEFSPNSFSSHSSARPAAKPNGFDSAEEVSPQNTPQQPSENFSGGPSKAEEGKGTPVFNFASTSNAQKTSPDPAQPTHASNNADNIRFANGDGRNNYQFSAGSASNGSERTERLRTRRAERRSPLRNQAFHSDRTASESQSETEGSDRGFDPNRWNFGPQTFVPKPGNNSTSPTRGPGHLRRTRSIRPTMGNAGLADESTSDEADGNADAQDAHSPNAMDIDDEPPVTAVSPPQPPPPPPPPVQSSGARNIPVEPTRPDWRAGDGTGRTSIGAHTPKTGPSEDSDEFRANFADFKNVAPFAAEAGGLNSFGDLKSNLPFETQASARIPISRKPIMKELPFPTPPQMAPPPMPLDGVSKPSPAMWDGYLHKFEEYMRLWDEFNVSVVTHFSARTEERKNKGYAFLATMSDEGMQDYALSVGQDMIVRQKWMEACAEHERRLREFMAFRRKMA